MQVAGLSHLRNSAGSWAMPCLVHAWAAPRRLLVSHPRRRARRRFAAAVAALAPALLLCTLGEAGPGAAAVPCGCPGLLAEPPLDAASAMRKNSLARRRASCRMRASCCRAFSAAPERLHRGALSFAQKRLRRKFRCGQTDSKPKQDANVDLYSDAEESVRTHVACAAASWLSTQAAGPLLSVLSRKTARAPARQSASRWITQSHTFTHAHAGAPFGIQESCAQYARGAAHLASRARLPAPSSPRAPACTTAGAEPPAPWAAPRLHTQDLNPA